MYDVLGVDHLHTEKHAVLVVLHADVQSLAKADMYSMYVLGDPSNTQSDTFVVQLLLLEVERGKFARRRISAKRKFDWSKSRPNPTVSKASREKLPFRVTCSKRDSADCL